MWARLCVLGTLASCYSAHALPGAPCSPGPESCPQAQSCALVGGSYVCIDGVGGDGGVDGPRSDTNTPVDARIDAPGIMQWALVQTAASSNMATTTIAASGAKHLIVVGLEVNASPVTSVTDNAGNAYVAIPSAHASSAAGGFGVEQWYATDSLPGATTITVTPTLHATVVWEVSGIRTTSPFDTATTLDDQPASTTPLGASITTSVDGEFVISIGIVANMVSGIHAGSEFTNDKRTYGNGWAHLTDPAAPAGSHQAQWDQPTSGVGCASSTAFLVGP